jgi:hypothetical protein
MYTKNIRKALSITIITLTALLIGGAATDAAAFSVDLKKLEYTDYSSPTTARKVVDYNFSGGTIGTTAANTIDLPAGAVPIRPPDEGSLQYTFGPYPDPSNAISMALDMGASKATLTTATEGGCIINTVGTPAPPVPQWTYAAKLNNFSDMTDTTKSYIASIGLGSMVGGPAPEFTAAWLPGPGGRSLVLNAEIYNKTLRTTVWGPFQAPVGGFNPVTDSIVLRIRCLDPAAGGNSMVFDYSLNEGQSWTVAATNTFGFQASLPPPDFPYQGFPGRFPYVSLRVESLQQQQMDPFQVYSFHESLDGKYYANVFVSDPGQAAYSSVSVSGSGCVTLASTPLTFGNGQWSLSFPVTLSQNNQPSCTQTFVFNAVKKAGGADTPSKSVTGYVVPFATNLSPTGNVSNPLVFSWTGFSGVESYQVWVGDMNHNMIWGSPNIPSTQTNIAYGGPALTPGQTYQYHVNSVINTAGSSNHSIASAQFTYTSGGSANTISFNGWVKTTPSWPSTIGMTAVSGAAVNALNESGPPPFAFTTTNTDGSFSITGIPALSTFQLFVPTPATTTYVPVLSKYMNWNVNIQALLPFVLFTQEQYAAFGNTAGTGMILGRVTLMNSPAMFLAGAVIEAREWTPGNPPVLGATYPVTYTSGSSTQADGIYMVKNVPDGKLVQLVATLPNHTFEFNGAVLLVKAGFISEESFFGTAGSMAQMTIYSNEAAFTAAAPSSTLINFEDRNTSQGRVSFVGNEYAASGVTFSSPNAQPLWVYPPRTGDLWTWPSNYLSPGNEPFGVNVDSNEDSLTLTFNPSVAAVGWTFLDMPNPSAVTIRVYDQSNALIHETLNGVGIAVGVEGNGFWGILSPTKPIARVEIIDTANNNDDVAYDNFRFTTMGGGAPTISFSANLKDYSNDAPISGAKVEMVGNASITTTTAADGNFTLPGLPPGAEFSVRITGDAAVYVPSYTAVMQSVNPMVSPRGYNLFKPAQLITWGVTGGRGLIRGRVLNGANQQDGYVSGAVVSYTSSKSNTYAVKYEDVQGNPVVNGTATTANGKYYILNVEEGDIVTVSATQANYAFSQSRKFIARDGAVCQGSISGNPIPGRVAIGGFVMNQATTAAPINSATVEQVGAAPVNSTVSNADGSYYLTVPAGTNLFLKFSKPQAGTLAPTYTAEMKFPGSYTNIGEFNLFTTTKLTDWAVTSGKGIIRSRVKDSAGNYLGGATVTAQGISKSYAVCYDDTCTATLTATDAATGRFVVKNVEPGDTVTVTAQKAGWSFNQRTFHTYADSVHQGSITGTTADESLIRSRFNALLAEFNKGALANIDTILSFFATNYLNDGEDRAALRANMLEGLNRVPFQPRPTPAGSTVTIAAGGTTAQMIVIWGNGEIETFTLTKDGTGVWMVTGNGKQYRVEAWSGTFQQPTGGNGYWVDMKVNDPLKVIDSVSVLGPKTGNTPETFSLIWNADQNAWSSWAAGQQSVGPQFGNTKPTVSPNSPLVYTFTITEKGNSTPVMTSAMVKNFVELFATPISPAPGSTVTGIPTFNWIGVGGDYTYGIEVGSSSGGSQWGRYNLTGTTYVYDGPALTAGGSYYHIQVRDADGNFSMVGVPFTYSGEILKGDIDGNGVVNLVDAILAVKVIAGQTPDGIRENYGMSGTDVNGDGQVGLHEGLYILQRIAGLRDALNVWHPRTPAASGTSTFFEAIAGPNGFLIGGQGTIQKSLDGVTWFISNIGSNSDNFLGLAGAADGALFAAGRFNGLVLKSTDVATTWMVSKAASDNLWEGISTGGGKIVAVGYNYKTYKAVIFTSADGGSTWTETTPSGVSVNFYNGVTYGNGKFVVVGYAYSGGFDYTAVILTSTDGSTWTPANVDAKAGLRGVTWGGGQFVAVGNFGAILTSPDGSNWAVQNSGIADKNLNHVGYGNGFYVIAGTDGTLLTSIDGVIWTSRPSGTTKHLWGVAFGKNTFLVVGGESSTSSPGPIILQSDPL